MAQQFRDYIWKNGKPQGIRVVDPQSVDLGLTYKIIADPYYKRISIEKYCDHRFVGTVYDSAIFDFRHLKQAEQNAWHKVFVSGDNDHNVSHIRNQDDRLILIEEYHFENQCCRECYTSSPHGVVLSRQKILYEHLGDPFNGVILYDSNEHVVMYKKYSVNTLDYTFNELLEDVSDMSLNHSHCTHFPSENSHSANNKR